jgi:4-carboxymuconolactone decarboxylase
MFQPLVDPEDPAVAAIVGEFSQARWGRVSALYGMMMHQPDIARAWLGLGSAVRQRTSLDDRERELMICLVAQVAGQSFEWAAHEPLALRAGATPDELAAILDRTRCATFSARDRLLLDFAEHVARATVDADAFAAAAAELSPAVLVEVATTVGYYVGTARFLDAFGITAGAPMLVAGGEPPVGGRTD